MGKQLREVTSPEMLRKSAKIREMLNRPAGKSRSSKLSLYLIRYAIGKLYRSIPKSKEVRFSKVSLNGTKAIVTELNEGCSDQNIIVYIHGGAFMSGSAFSTRGYASSVAVCSGCRVYSIDYSLSPEVKFPVAFDECMKAIKKIGEDNPDSKITLIGDSAGANLCLATTLKMKDKISCVILNSPVIDFSDTIDRARFNKDSVVVKKGLKASFEKLYFGEHDPKDPAISPFFGEYDGMPPMFITCDKDEGLYADSEAVYEKCEAVGTKVEMVAMKGAFHAFAVMGDSTPETKKLMEDYISFMKKATSDD